MAKAKARSFARRPRRARKERTAAATRVRGGRTERRQLERMESGKLWCYACCASHPDPGTEDETMWACANGHGGVWYVDELGKGAPSKDEAA